MDYIPIESIDEIDVKKISVRDINKRYIDKQGNRFATRFNLKKRKIEIVRLARNQNEASTIRGAIMQGKKEKLLNLKQPTTNSPPETEKQTAPEPELVNTKNIKPGSSDLDFEKSEGGLSNDSSVDIDDSDFLEEKTDATSIKNKEEIVVDSTNMLEQPFLESLSKELDRFKERQQMIMNQLKDFPKEVLNQQVISDLFREIDVQCWQEAENCVNYFKELYGYPRSLSQYLNRLENHEKEKIEQLASEKERMDTIKRIESARSFLTILKVFQTKSIEIKNILDSVPAEEKQKAFSGKEKQLKDLETTIDLLIQNTLQKIAEVNSWAKKYAVIRV